VRLVSTEALLLDVTDFQERDRLVTLLTREHGRKRGVAQGARRRYSRFAGVLQPLAKVTVTWFEKEGRELVRLRDAELVRPAAALLGDLEGILVGSYLAEHVAAFAQEDAPAEALFRLLDATLEALAGGLDRDLAARYLECWVLRLEGLFPPPRECPECGAELTSEVRQRRDGTLVCGGCARSDPGAVEVSRAAVVWLLGLSRLPPAALGEVPLSPAGRREIEQIAARVRREFLGHELRSYQVITQMGGFTGASG
jgi:DNA repair protein RecO (recombination protein O)